MGKKKPESAYQPSEVLFPAYGIDLQTALESQRPGTTPQAQNVRLYEPSTQRARGGSRPGIVKLLDDQLENGSLIQHLAVIVDPSEDALIDSDNSGDFPDPSTNNLSIRNPPGRKLRTGGSGKRTNRNNPKKPIFLIANNQDKDEGEEFTFAGNEFTIGAGSVLDIGDSVTSATLYSAGASSGAGEGSYPITIRAAQGAVAPTIPPKSFSQKYKVTYTPGVMTVEGTPPPDVWTISYSFAFTFVDNNGFCFLQFSPSLYEPVAHTFGSTETISATDLDISNSGFAVAGTNTMQAHGSVTGLGSSTMTFSAVLKKNGSAIATLSGTVPPNPDNPNATFSYP